jgi:hypothetical protein
MMVGGMLCLLVFSYVHCTSTGTMQIGKNAALNMGPTYGKNDNIGKARQENCILIVK